MYRIDALLKQHQKIFHTRDLALLWGIDNPNTLYTTIKRYIQKGILIPVQKGLYATVPLDQLDPYALGLAMIHTYAYVSCESILVAAGIMFQASEVMTVVSSVSKRFTLAGRAYLVRTMADRFLYNDAGVERENGILTATLPRAVADMVYFNPRIHFDNPKAIDWKTVRALQKEVGFI